MKRETLRQQNARLIASNEGLEQTLRALSFSLAESQRIRLLLGSELAGLMARTLVPVPAPVSEHLVDFSPLPKTTKKRIAKVAKAVTRAKAAAKRRRHKS